MKVRRIRWRRAYSKKGGPSGIGLRCKDFFGGCIVCESYRHLDEHGRFPSSDEAIDICDEVLGNPPRESYAGPYHAV